MQFVDYGRSFDAGINIQEDNWVHQAKRAGFDVSMIGDDTVRPKEDFPHFFA